MSDIRQLLHGLQHDAGAGADAPVALRTKIQRAVGRRRVTRDVAGGSLAVVAAGALAWGVVKVGGDSQAGPAAPELSAVPTASSSASPSASETSEPSEAPEAPNSEVFPWDTYLLPQLLPATQEAADAVLNPTAGPSVNVGVLEPSSSFPSWDASICAPLGDSCGRLQAPPITREALPQVTPAWAAITDSVFGQSGVSAALSALYLASPEGDVYTLLDVAALGEQLGMDEATVSGVALDGTARTMILAVESLNGDDASVLLVDLDAGSTVILAEPDWGSVSLARDGDSWLLWGNEDGAPFAARIAPDASSWDVDGMWAVRDGRVESAGGRLVVRSGDGFLLAPQSDLSLMNISAPSSQGEQCEVAGVDDRGFLRYCADGAAGENSPQRVGWDGVVTDAPDAPVLPEVPLQRWAVVLGDGILEITPSVFGDNAEVPAGTPDYEWHRADGTQVIDGPASGSVRWSGLNGAAVWLTQNRGMSVIDSDGVWHNLFDWPDTAGLGYANEPRFLDLG